MSWPSTRLQELFEIDLPIIQAPMAGAQLSAMTIAVCQAGGLGSLPCAMLSAEQLRRELDTIRRATSKPFNVNFFCHHAPVDDPVRDARWRQRLAPYYAELGVDPSAPVAAASRAPFDETMCALVEEYKPRVVSFHFGLPDAPLLERVRKSGARIISSATTVDEAQWLEAHGCDAIIAQGLEAGGHRGLFLTDDLATQLPTFALVPLIVGAVSVPVIAAGGIMEARGMAAAFALGADGVQIGTAYLFTPEATVSAAHRQALRLGTTPTVVTNVISGRPARGIRNRVIRELGPLAEDAPHFPLGSTPLAPLRAAAEKRGSGDFSPFWAGQAYPLGREVSAGHLTRTLAAETLARFKAIATATTDVAPGYSRADVQRSGMTPVGLTARWIAASRAVESERSDRLFHDPFARDLAGSDGFAFRRAIGNGMSTPDNRDPHLAIRTRFFDDALLQWAVDHSSPQIVLLAAGMDSRAFRLDWPPGTVLFEIDRPEIFDYKEPILQRLRASAKCDRRVVPADLAGDWNVALLRAGFDTARPTAVSAEGLVMYLEEADAIRLFKTLETLVPAGSWLGLDFVNTEMLTSPYTSGLIQLLDRLGCPWHFGIADPEAFFERHGWKATLTLPGDPEASYGIWPFPPVPRNYPNVPRSYFARGEKT